MVVSRRLLAALSIPLALGLAAQAVSAASVTFSGASGALAASATFEVIGSSLQITVTNTASVPTPNNAALLENVFFNSANLGVVGSTAFLSSIATAPGSGPVLPATSASNFGVYGFGTGNGGPVNGKYGIGGTGWLFDFDSAHLLSLTGSNPNPTSSPAGPDGGLASASTTTFSPKNAISNTLIYTIAIAGPFNLDSIGNVIFTYGTGADDFSSICGNPPPPSGGAAPSTPLPAAAWSGMALLSGLAGIAKMRKRQSRA